MTFLRDREPESMAFEAYLRTGVRLRPAVFRKAMETGSVLLKFNPYHDARGRFTDAAGDVLGLGGQGAALDGGGAQRGSAGNGLFGRFVNRKGDEGMAARAIHTLTSRPHSKSTFKLSGMKVSVARGSGTDVTYEISKSFLGMGVPVLTGEGSYHTINSSNVFRLHITRLELTGAGRTLGKLVSHPNNLIFYELNNRIAYNRDGDLVVRDVNGNDNYNEKAGQFYLTEK